MVPFLRRVGNKIAEDRRKHPRLFWLRAVAVAAVAALFVFIRSFWTPDTLFIVLFALFAILGHTRAFLVRFAPFLILLLAYDSSRSIADNLNHTIHYVPTINFDKFLFGGTLPTVDLQHLLWHGHVQWYDFYFYFLYIIHFLMPVLLAVLIWRIRDDLYWPYVGAFVGLSFAGFITYVLFPAAPPWMASDHGLIPHVHRISSNVWAVMGVDNFSELYSKFSPNDVAAVPSLHAAYPTLTLLFSAKIFGWRRMWWLAIYPLSLWIGVVYLGEHYVTDVLLGIGYAVVAYMASMRVHAWKTSHPWHLRKRLVPRLQLVATRLTGGRYQPERPVQK